MQRYLEQFEKERMAVRLRIFFWFVIAVGLLITFRFGQLQVFQGDKWRMIATENQFRKVRVAANRGLVLDRKGRILAGNRPGFNLTLIPADINKKTVAQARGNSEPPGGCAPAENQRKRAVDTVCPGDHPGKSFLGNTFAPGRAFARIVRG